MSIWKNISYHKICTRFGKIEKKSISQLNTGTRLIQHITKHWQNTNFPINSLEKLILFTFHGFKILFPTMINILFSDIIMYQQYISQHILDRVWTGPNGVGMVSWWRAPYDGYNCWWCCKIFTVKDDPRINSVHSSKITRNLVIYADIKTVFNAKIKWIRNFRNACY